jgi:hypothetical protein
VRKGKSSVGSLQIIEGLKAVPTKYKCSDPIGVLKAGSQTVRHHTLGWLKADLIASGMLDDTKEALHAKIWADYNDQKIYIRAQQDIMGEDFNPLHTIPGRDFDGKFLFTKTVDVPKNHLSLAYLLHAYDVNDSTFKRLRARGGTALPKQVPHNKGQSVLKDKEYSDIIFNARNYFVKSQMRKWLSHNNQQASTKRKAERRKWLRSKWDTEKEKDPSFGEAYDKKARDHAKRQEGAKGELVQIMNRNARRSYASLEKAMNNWCSWKTIERFLKSNDDFKTYSQNIRPLLSEGNRLKQVSFSIHVHNRWGLAPGTKRLWTMRYNPMHSFMNDSYTITYP